MGNRFDLDNYGCDVNMIHSTSPQGMYVGLKSVEEWTKFALMVDGAEHAQIVNPFPSSSNWKALLVQACRARKITNNDRENGYRRHFAARHCDLGPILTSTSRFLVQKLPMWQITHLSFRGVHHDKCGLFLAKAIQTSEGPLESLQLAYCGFLLPLFCRLASEDCSRSRSLRKLSVDVDYPVPVELFLASKVTTKSSVLSTIKFITSESEDFALRCFLGPAARCRSLQLLEVDLRVQDILGVSLDFIPQILPVGISRARTLFPENFRSWYRSNNY